MNRSTARTILAGLLVAAAASAGCASVQDRVEPSPNPGLVFTPPAEPVREVCTLAEPVRDSLNAQWQALKASRANHPTVWTLRDDDIDTVVAMASSEQERVVLERLYRNRFGTPVYLVDGRPNADARKVEETLHEVQPDAVTSPLVAAMHEHDRLRAAIETHVADPLTERDLQRHCALNADQLAVENLTRESLLALETLDGLLSEARHSTARLDTSLVLTTWHLAARFDDRPSRLKDAVRVARKGDFDAEALSRAVYAVLRYDSDKRPYEEVGPLIRKVILAAQNANLDPFVMVTLVFMESRFRPDATGDGGLACGMAQQHAEYSMEWGLSDVKQKFTHMRVDDARYQRQRRYECDLLKTPDYAMKVLVYVLRLIKTRVTDLDKEICRYNEGPFARCKGRGLYYQKKHEWWRDTIKVTYDRIRSSAPEEGAVAAGE